MSLHELDITALSHDGRGIGFLSPSKNTRGKAVMVSGALPGQTVLCEIHKDHARHSEGETVRVVRQAPCLREPLCPHSAICGGCQLQLLPYSSQLHWKASLAREALVRIGGIDRDTLNAIWRDPQPSPLEEGYRNKTEFAFGFDSAGLPALGFRSRSSHQVFPLSFCATAGAEATEAAKVFYKTALDSGLPFFGEHNEGYWRFFILRETEAKPEKKWIALCITSGGRKSEREKTREAGKALLEKLPFIQAFIHEERLQNDFLPLGQKRVCILDRDAGNGASDGMISKKMLNQPFFLDCAGFFQINNQAADILAQTILQMDDTNGPMLDVYCGCGAPGILLAKNHSSAIALEIDKKAAAFARKNAQKANLENYRVITGDAGKLLRSLPKREWSLALLDPPRSGMDKNALAGILAHCPENIIYVSCNPVTLARDARTLASLLAPVKITGVDLFPQTPHLECVSLWKRKDRKGVEAQ